MMTSMTMTRPRCVVAAKSRPRPSPARSWSWSGVVPRRPSVASASQSDDTPTSVESTSAEPAVTPAIATQPSMSRPPAAHARDGTTATCHDLVATGQDQQGLVARHDHRPPSRDHPGEHDSTETTDARDDDPSGLDTRPALGMPCGPDQNGAAAVSNGGGPVNCVSTPGGFAWEPPGVQRRLTSRLIQPGIGEPRRLGRLSGRRRPMSLNRINCASGSGRYAEVVSGRSSRPQPGRPTRGRR